MEKEYHANGKTVGLYTLGCKVAQYETEAIGEAFMQHGFALSDFGAVCDVYVINTCTVTAESDRKSRQVIRRALRQNPGAIVMVTGCYSQRAPDEVAGIGGVSVVIGTGDKLSLVRRAEELLAGRDGGEEIGGCRISTTDVWQEEFEPMRVTRAPRTRAYVKIEDGCECRCSYCAISPARGRVRSKTPEDAIAEIEALYRSGTREVVLTGIEIGSYGKDLIPKCSLADLVLLLDEKKSCERVRLGSLAPELIGEEFARKIAGAKILAPHFHISMQSGSDAVLAGMRRRYTAERALENIRRLKTLFPDAMFTADLMVGFPGESEEDFEKTLAFAREVRLLQAHVFAYSRRRGTPADEMPCQIPEPEKRRRSEILIRECEKIKEELLGEVIREGKPLSCVFETKEDGLWVGHSASYIEVAAASDDDLHGEMRDLIPLRYENGILIGKIL